MSKMIERVCQCGCGETFMARARDIKRGWGKYKNRSHASSGSNNPYWRGGRSTNRYYYKLRAIVQHPLEHKCRCTLARAVKGGILKRGCCEFCGDPKTEAHHEDYSKPLQVRWLCSKHHRIADRWRREREKLSPA